MDIVPQIVPISDMRLRYAQVVDQLDNGPVILAQRSKPAAVLVSIEDWNSVIEEAKQYRHLTLLEQRSKEMDDGHYVTHEEFMKGLEERGLA